MNVVYKSTLLVFCALLALSSCDKSPSESGKDQAATNQVVPDAQKPIMTFESATYQFGTATEGAEVSHDFSFTNTGKTDLLISNAVASCGCTVPEWPKEPIRPGGKGMIKTTFNTEGKQGHQHKTITITANTKDKVEVMIEGEVLPKKESKI